MPFPPGPLPPSQPAAVPLGLAVPYTQVEGRIPGLAGPHASALSRLAALGVEVAPGFVIPAAAFASLWNDAANVLPPTPHAVRSTPLPPEYVREWNSALEALRPTADDSADAEAAGFGVELWLDAPPRRGDAAHLGIRVSEGTGLAAAVRELWASGLEAANGRGSTPAEAAEASSVDRPLPGMAAPPLVAQGAGASETVGIVRQTATAADQSPRWEVVATWGSSRFGLPAGPADTFLVDAQQGNIVSRAIVAKGTQLIPTELGFAPQAVRPGRAQAPCLTDEEVARLCETAARAAAALGPLGELAFRVDWVRSARRIRVTRLGSARGLPHALASVRAQRPRPRPRSARPSSAATSPLAA